MDIRLQKFLADAGVASRRKAETYILAGQIKVNGITVRQLGTKVNENDTVTWNGKTIENQQKYVYYMLNKPVGYVTTVKDQFDRPTVMDLIPTSPKERIFPVGRLDYQTTGLLLLTNDGALTYQLTHPSSGIEKVYRAKLFGTPTKMDIKQFQNGLVLDDQKLAPAKLEVLEHSERFSIVTITILEGKNRQVRKMCEAIHHPVAALARISVGKLLLGDLPIGQHRRLTEKEIAYAKTL